MHNSLIPLLLNSLPFTEDICKWSARFILCLQSKISLVWSVACFAILADHCLHYEEILCTVVSTSDGILICLLLVRSVL